MSEMYVFMEDGMTALCAGVSHCPAIPTHCREWDFSEFKGYRGHRDSHSGPKKETDTQCTDRNTREGSHWPGPLTYLARSHMHTHACIHADGMGSHRI